MHLTGRLTKRLTNSPAVTLAVSALAWGVSSGLALGVLWWRLAPRVPLVVRPEGSSPQTYQPDGYLGADLGFCVLAVLAGILLAIGLVTIRRQQVLAVLAWGLLAGIAGSLLMWQVGVRLGSVDIAGLVATTQVEAVVDAPLAVSMPAVLLAWPISTAAVIVVISVIDWVAAVRVARLIHPGAQ
ncbi:MAG: hypothetical protein ACKOW5_07290 [Actinomycetales bacterium]